MIVLRKCVSSLCWVVSVTGFLALSAHAGQHGKNGPASFSDFDADQNGQVSEQEFNAFRSKRMAARAAEGKKMRRAASAPSFAEIDADANGYIDPEELAAAQQAHRAKAHDKMAHGHGKEHGKGHGKGYGKEHGKGMKGKMPTFADFDKDGNGAIDETEFNRGHAEHMSKMAAAGHKMKHAPDSPGFAGIDSNGDGVISKDEFAAHHAEHRKHMKEGSEPDNS